MEAHADADLLEPAAVRLRTERGALSGSSHNSHDSAGIRDELASIGEQIKALQLQLSSNLSPETKVSGGITQTLWDLLWRLRTFLFLASPSAARQWRIGGALFDVYSRGNYGKDAAHVAIGLRLYLVLLRFTVVCPAAALHGCLTLLGVLAVLNDPRLRSWKDTSERLVEGFLFVSRALHRTEKDVFAHIINVAFQLLEEVTVHFNGSAADPESALFLQLSIEPSAALLSQTESSLLSLTSPNSASGAGRKARLFHEIFSTCTCVETLYEARCIQACLLRLVVRLSEERLLFSLSPHRVGALCDAAGHLVSSAVSGDEGGVVNRVQHDAAWHALRYFAVVDRRFLPHLQGPLILSLLASQWSGRGADMCTSVLNITASEKALFDWCRALSREEVDSLVAAAFHRGGTGPGGQGALTECLAQMWEVAVQWCGALYTNPSTAVNSIGRNSSSTTSSTVSAMVMLQQWVLLCERVFQSTVVQTSALAGITQMGEPKMLEAYNHQLQILVSELPLASFTASLLCTQLPLFAVESELAFLPNQILSFFNVEALSTCVAKVVEHAKSCIDVCAFRLLEANALAVQARLKVSSSRLPCDAAAFKSALAETLQVLQHHEAPSYSFLVQAIIILVHTFPVDSENGAVRKSDTVAHVMQELDNTLAARHDGSYAGLEVTPALWHMLERETATAFFRAGSGLGWTRRLLTLPLHTATSAKTSELFLCRAAGLAEALQHTLAQTIWKDDTSARRPHFNAPVVNALSVAAVESEQVSTCRLCTYASTASHFPVVLQLLQTLSTLLARFQSDAQWLRCMIKGDAGMDADVHGTAVALENLARHATNILVLLIEAKYVFAAIAGPEVAKDRTGSFFGAHSTCEGVHVTKKPAEQAATVVDVDVDDDDSTGSVSKNKEAKRPYRLRKSTTSGTTHRVKTAKASTETAVDGEPGAPSLSQPQISKTRQLEKIVQVNRSKLLPTLLTFIHHFDYEANGKREPREAGGTPEDDDRSIHAAASRVHNSASTLESAMVSFAHASLALSPPFSLNGVKELFSPPSRSVYKGGDRICYCALREYLLWSSKLASLESEAGDSAIPTLRLVLLSGTERLLSTVFSAKRESNTSCITECGTQILQLLRFGRCFFQRSGGTGAIADDKPGSGQRLSLTDVSAALQEDCMAASERLTQEGHAWLCLCFDLYAVYHSISPTHNDTALAVMGLCIETARCVMALFSWSATDLPRFRERPFVFSSFFKAIVDKEDRDLKVIVTSSLDVLGRYALSGGVDQVGGGIVAAAPTISTVVLGESTTRAKLKDLMEQEKVPDWSVAAGALAYVLYECGSKPVSKQMVYLAEAVSYANKSVKDVPAMVRSTIHFIAFHIVSLEADAQMLAHDRRCRSGRYHRRRLSRAAALRAPLGVVGLSAHSLFVCDRAEESDGAEEADVEDSASPPQHTTTIEVRAAGEDASDMVASQEVLDGIAFSVFERALGQLVTLSEAAETPSGVENALRKPVVRAVAAEELRKNMFAVLDAVCKAIHIEPVLAYCNEGASTADGEAGVASSGSLQTRRRWLLGLASFIRFMGPQTTPIALMLPTLLGHCARFPSLLPSVCIVWRELIFACTDEYLTESAAAIVLSLVSLEQQAALESESKGLLLCALRHLYSRTDGAEFWDSYKVVLGTFSELVRATLHSRHADGAKTVEGSQEICRDNAHVLLLGFASVMRSGSLQSSTVFVRALYQYLSAADEVTRRQLSHAAADHPEVLQTLLRCPEADSDSALYAMRCISILGAVAAPSAAMPTSAQRPTSTVDNEGRSLLAPSSASPLDTGSRIACTQSFYLDAETVLNWRKFSFTLLRDYFPRVFASTADPVLHKCIAFAVQELIRASTRQERLQHKGVELRREDVVHVDELDRYVWWMRLTPHVKQLLGGFTTTRYSLTVNFKTSLRTPEYTPSLEYRPWLFAFFNHLVTSCKGWFAEMVQPLRNAAKKNASLVLYLLPYLVVHILESGKSEDVQYIECEVKAVLEAAAGGPNAPVLSLRSQSIYETSPEIVSQEDPREHAHTVLSLLEDVEQLRWTLLRNRGRLPCVFEPQEQAESLCIRLADVYGDFLRSIPWKLRCSAALRIGSHIRALRSVESQRRIPGLASVIAVVPLQRIFAALNDRESSRSIHRATPGLSLEETAFSFENNGDWLSALGSCELVLQHRPESGQHQLTALHCMNELGELYMTSRYAGSLLATPPIPHGDVQEFKPTEYLFAAALKGSSTFSDMVSETPGGVAAAGDVAQLRQHVQAYANEAAWRLGQWDALLPSNMSLGVSGALGSSEMPTMGSDSGRSVSLAMPATFLHRALSGSGSLALVRSVTDRERAKVVPLVRTPFQEDLTAQGFTVTLLLHALGDVDAVSELCARAFTNGGKPHCDRDSSGASQSNVPMMKVSDQHPPSSVKEEIESFLTQRESYVEDTIAAREPLLALHRLIYRELHMPQKVAETWLKQSELLRNSGLGEAALTAARQAAFECREHVAETSYYVLVASLLHDTQSPTPAMKFARECVADVRIPATTRAQLQILLTNWMIETGSERPEHIFAEYEKARELDRKSELVHHQMALFYDHLHTLASNASEGAAAHLKAAAASPTSCNTANMSTAAMYNAALQPQKEMVDSIQRSATHAIVHFGESLLRGVEKASVSLPRMLTLWLDSAVFLGSLLSTTAGKLDGTTSTILGEMNNRIREFVLSTVRPVIPPAVVMTALPQLLSRLGHPVAAVRNVLTDIVLHLMHHFPQQCLWLVLPMALSKEGPKEVVETQIIKPFADNPCNERVLRHAKILCDTLLTICNCSASLFPKEKGLTALSPVQKITPMLAAAKFVVPVLSTLTPNIRANSIEDVFPTAPYFDRFDDRVVVMRSLQKPKRIWVHTNDGRQMSFLCKAKDEPRKDIRMMEVAGLMNSFFLSDPEAKRKRFCLRRYSITALSDDCAVIEWLNDTTPLAKVAMECYALDRSGVHISSVKKWMALVDEKKMSKMELFTKYILPEAPPVMHQWLVRTFASNQSWYEARTLFTQSTALWSIAGHIVGLGDRHAENLMINMGRGELMHVDFACMFDKGEKLEVPEVVRFRLTQNLTDVMGVLGAYGPFQATCETALRCEMKNKSAVMPIIETLLHEPLLEWRRQSSRSHTSNGPKQLMERVARRLDGFLDLYSVSAQRDTLSLNVESQVAKLIHHSSDLNNLSQMYIWWMAWI